MLKLSSILVFQYMDPAILKRHCRTQQQSALFGFLLHVQLLRSRLQGAVPRVRGPRTLANARDII